MNYLIIYAFLFSFIFATSKSTSLGMSDKLGVFGLVSTEHTRPLADIDNGALVLSYGFMGIPTIGGAAATLSFSDDSKRLSTYFNVSGMCVYIVPMSSSSSSPEVLLRPLLNISVGLNFKALKLKKKTVGINLGVMSIYDFGFSEIFTSPSDIPYIWPTFNIKISRKVPTDA